MVSPSEIEAKEETQVEEVEETEEEPDYKALYEEEKSQRTREKEAQEKAEKDQRSRDVQLLQQKQRDGVAQETLSLTRKLLDKVNRGDLDENEIDAELQKGLKGIQEAAESTSQAEQVRLIMVEAESLLRDTSERLGFGRDLDDDKFDRVILFWNEAVQARNDGKYEVADVRRRDALSELERVEKVVEADKGKERGKKTDLTINPRAARSAAGGESKQSLVNRMADPTQKLTPAEMVEAGKAMDEGIYPRA